MVYTTQLLNNLGKVKSNLTNVAVFLSYTTHEVTEKKFLLIHVN